MSERLYYIHEQSNSTPWKLKQNSHKKIIDIDSKKISSFIPGRFSPRVQDINPLAWSGGILGEKFFDNFKSKNFFKGKTQII